MSSTSSNSESGIHDLLEIHDQDVAAAFAIEALLLIDHYNFLDRYAAAKGGGGAAKKKAKGKKAVAKKKK